MEILQRPTLPPAPAVTLYADDDVAVGHVGNVCVAIWRGAVTVPSFEKQRDNLSLVVNKHPEGAAFVCVIEPTAKPPNEELRRASVEMIASHKSVLRANAVVVEGVGFSAALTRGVISGMRLLFREDTPSKVFASVVESATWVGTLLKGAPSARMMVAGVTEIRSRIGVSSRAR